MHRLKQLSSRLRSSFWVVPSLLVAAGVALAVALVAADSALSDKWMTRWPRLFGATPEGARQVLATIAGSMMTVIGVTFSMTLVALALASSQYTSRILRNFMGNRVTLSTLGIFAGIFAYCLIVLHTIRNGEGEGVFVPGLALFFGFLLALGSVAILIYFIHHIATSIQASSIIAAVAAETLAVIDEMFPQKLGRASDDEEDEAPQSPKDQTWHRVASQANGYIQNVDSDGLMRLAQDTKAILRMERGIGEFVVEGDVLAALALDNPPAPDVIAALNACYTVSSHRTVDNDPAFGIRQIVDIALRALSPGVNETSTAVICVDYLSAILTRLAARRFPALHRSDAGQLRVIAKAPTFESLLGIAFDQIRRNAAGNVAILSRLLGAFEVIGAQARSPRRQLALRQQVQQLAELGDRSIESPDDRARLEERLARVRKSSRAEPLLAARAQW